MPPEAATTTASGTRAVHRFRLCNTKHARALPKSAPEARDRIVANRAAFLFSERTSPRRAPTHRTHVCPCRAPGSPRGALLRGRLVLRSQRLGPLVLRRPRRPRRLVLRPQGQGRLVRQGRLALRTPRRPRRLVLRHQRRHRPQRRIGCRGPPPGGTSRKLCPPFLVHRPQRRHRPQGRTGSRGAPPGGAGGICAPQRRRRSER